MPAPVVIEVTAVSPDTPALEAMLEACGRALGTASCVLARQAPEPPYAAVAIVTLQGEGRVRVEVGLRKDEHSDWRSRELVFQVHDQELERWRAVGFVVGSLASAAASPPEADASSEQSKQAEPQSPQARKPDTSGSGSLVEREKPATPRPLRRAWFGLSVIVGDGLEDRFDRFGVAFEAAARPLTAPLFVSLNLGYSSGGSKRASLNTSYWDAGLGLGVVAYESMPIALDFGMSAGPERFSANASQDFIDDQAARWLLCAKGGLRLTLFPGGPLGASAGALLVWRGGETKIVAHGQNEGSVTRVGYEFGLGFSWRIPQ